RASSRTWARPAMASRSRPYGRPSRSCSRRSTSSHRPCAGRFRASTTWTSSNGSSGWASSSGPRSARSPSSRTTCSSDESPTRLVVVRSPPRSVHALLHRDVGAVQLLRDARVPHPVHDEGARLHRSPRGRRVWQLCRQRVAGRDLRRDHRRPLAGALPQRPDRRDHHRAGPLHARVSCSAVLLRRPLVDRHRYRATQAERLTARPGPGATGPRAPGEPLTAQDLRRIVAVLVFFLFASFFWGAYEQAGSTLNLFADRYVHLELLGIKLYASWFVSIQAAFVILLSPIFAWLWVKLGPRQPSSPAKFALALLFVGLAFVLLMPAGAIAQGGVKISPLWLVAVYFIEELGELCLSPVGLSVVTKLAPRQVIGLMMG